MDFSTSWAGAGRAGFASLALLAAAGAAQADNAPAYDKDKAALADSVVLNPQSTDEIEVGVAAQANIYCLFNAGSKKPITFEVPIEFAAFGYPKGTDLTNITPKWLVLACGTGEAYMGDRDVVEAKHAQMWERIQRMEKSNRGAAFGGGDPGSTVIGPAGVVGEDGKIKPSPDMKVIEGSPNP